ncbi:MAG TPA: NAD(P)/FAD-dependent oxidoreductase [Polyangiaceae bacterium]
MDIETEVVIIGGGAAGLSAARLLTKHGLSCVVVEAAQQLGGRIRTLRVPEWQLPIELGAEFVHGRPAPSLAFDELELLRVPEHRVRSGTPPQLMPDTWSKFAAAMRDARDAPGSESVRDYLGRRKLAPSDSELVQMLVEGYHAAPLDDVSARAIADDATSSADDFQQYRASAGYDALLHAIERDLHASSCQLLLQARVRRIEWRAGSVTVSADAASESDELRVVARGCVVTTSVGVLRSPPSEGGIEFRPVPEAFASALPGLGMGYVTRLVLRFEQAPWLGSVAGHTPTFVHVADAPFATFWRQVSGGQEQLTAWAGGPLAFELSALDETSRVDAALRSLAQATQHSFLDCKDRLLGAHTHDFNRDPLVRGAYSYVRPGATDPARALREPCEGTLFFAGEALDLRYPATVAGALGSGEHAARKLLATCR